MRRYFSLAFLLLFFFAPLATAQQNPTPPAATDEIIVKYKEATPENEKQKLHQLHKAIRKQRIDTLRIEVVKVNSSSRDATIKEYRKNKYITYAEPNYKAQAFAISNDTSLSQQWGLFKINAANATTASAWDVTIGSPTVKVAILDSGIDASHPDLSGKVLANANFTTSSTLNDVAGHGTHVAGITAASTNNEAGVAGTGYNTVLLNGKVLGDDGSGYYSWIANGLVWAADQGAKVINLSLGGSSSSQALQDAVNYAWSKGVVVVAAAGNNGNSNLVYPAAYTNVIAVAATDSNDSRASFSNYGSWVDIAAPGVSIYSTYKDTTYATLSGTSMATPFAAGTAALIWAKGDCTTNSCVRSQLEGTAEHISGTGTLWSSGRINAYNAVNATAPAPTATLTPTPVKSLSVSDISMSHTRVTSTTRRISSVITVVNETSNTPLSGVTVKATITSPSGIVTNFSNNTGTNGKVTFRVNSKEKGIFTTTITTLTKSAYVYHPTLTTKTLLVQ